jgi:hypothetical protein
VQEVPGSIPGAPTQKTPLFAESFDSRSGTICDITILDDSTDDSVHLWEGGFLQFSHFQPSRSLDFSL